MAFGILGKKLGMTQIFSDDGQVTPVTVIKAGPCLVLQKKTKAHDGYDAVQLGLIGPTPRRLRTKPALGHVSKSKAGNVAYIKEIRGNEMHQYEVGQIIPLDIFTLNDFVCVTGISKGKGFQGTIKRYRFSGLSATHGTHKKQRSPGAIGQCAWPAKTFKGMKMPGRMGGVKTTIKNIKIVQIIPDKNLILVRGAIPGSTKGKIIVTKKAGQSSQQTE
ncbi:50S ribosomal protein L3 [candidate division CSSED10-310 bacterium]|uniref:Large ribosomal subunit protein uL3 n=1 Tax=candidate division CSSED10-310 bacterium TaxID=2855610 RepID=A0ABV6YX97_UNCC1